MLWNVLGAGSDRIVPYDDAPSSARRIPGPSARFFGPMANRERGRCRTADLAVGSRHAIEKRKGKTMNAGKIALTVIGGFGVLLSAALLAGGVSLIDGEAPGTDANGYYSTDAHHLGTPTHALASDGLNIDSDAGWLLDDGRFASVQVSGSSADPLKDIFIGVASRTAVAAYLDGVAWDEVSDLDVDPFQGPHRTPRGCRGPGGATSPADLGSERSGCRRARRSPGTPSRATGRSWS